MSDEILTVMKSRVLAAAEKCPRAKDALREIFAEAFESEWEDVTASCRIATDSSCHAAVHVPGKVGGEPYYFPFDVCLSENWKGGQDKEGNPKTEPGSDGHYLVFRIHKGRIWLKQA